ncbi:MAG: alpha-amylase family glycosyl hydrolase [Agathobacter sp.]
MKRKVKQILSFVLMIAMVLTMGSVSNLGRVVVKAADSVKLYFELPEGASVTDWAVNVWGTDISVVGDSEHAFRPTSWGDGGTYPTLLADENLSGWGYVTVSGSVQGMQFVDKDGYQYNCWNSQIAKQNLTAAYFVPGDDGAGVWYQDSSKENEIKEAEIQNIFVVAGDAELTGISWSATASGNEKNVLKQDATDTTVYSITYENVPKGTYSYQILQDPDNKGWKLPWGVSGNRTLKLTAKSNVTLSIDLDAETKDVATSIEPLEEPVEDPEYKNFIIHIKNDKNWEKANIKFGSGSSWTPIEGLEDAKNNEFGVAIEEDAVNAGWFTYAAKLPGSVTEINGLFNCGAWGDANQSDNFKVDLSKDQEAWITFVDAKNATVIKTSYSAPLDWKNDVNVHFQNELNWKLVNAKFGAGTSWDPIEGYEDYKNNGFGNEISADENNTGWYSYHVGLSKDITEVQGLFNNGSWGTGNQTANYSITGISGDKEVWITFTSTGLAVSEERPSEWQGKELLTVPRTYEEKQEEEDTLVSPVINEDGTVTFLYENEGASAVYLCGNMNDWASAIGNEKYAFSKNTDGVWTLTISLAPGSYEYKFVVDGSWITDPLNTKYANGNSAFVIKGTLTSPVINAPFVTFQLQDNGYEKVALCGSMNGWGNAINDGDYALTKNEDGVWSITLKLAEGAYSYKFVTDGGNWMVDPLNEEKDVYGNSVVDVPASYIYNVYYYDANEAHMSVDAADMHVWEVGGGNIGDLSFDEIVEIDGNQWLKGTIYTAATSLGIIPRSIGAWNWQTGNHYFTNTDKQLENNIYIVYGDDANTYTSVPEIKEARKRYVIVEYNRPQGDYEGWNIYSWNTGLASETEIYTQNLNGKNEITVPVKDSEFDFDMQFCMRRTTADAPWAQKDGGDHAIIVPGDQLVVKAIFDQDKGVTKVLPYNKGYEMDGAAGKITFLYRDDALMLSNTEASLEGKVAVVVNGVSHEMTYNAENERYEFALTGISTGDYAYYYVVDGEEMLDAFNAEKTTYNDRECSVITYKSFADLEIHATLSNEKMDSGENNVLTVTLDGDDATSITSDEIASITMDLEELGLGTRSINKDLMSGVISVKTGTSNGKKNIPVTMTDIYGNVYSTTASVIVMPDEKADFDWDEAVIYFAVTDRFFDGNTENNDGVNKDGSLSYHGGDFAGLTQKLDYLKELGVNTIWITPIVENSNTTTKKDGEVIESTGYHGYWASDFTKLNSHLGTEEEFSALIAEAHNRGMKLMVDVVLNHSGYADETTGFDPEEYFNNILVNEETGETIPMLRDASNTISGDDVYSSLAGLPDFVTEDACVREQLIEWQVDWVEKYGIDYFRVDTVKHVDAETWQAFKNALTEVDADFKMIGEYSGHGYTSSQLGIGGMDSLLDFDFNDQAQSFVTGNISGVESFMANRNAGIDNTQTVGAFLSSHDENGLVYKLINDCNMTEEEALNAFKVAAALQLTAKGQAVIYYGEEIGLYGADNYPYQTNRYDFDWNLVEEQSADENSMLNHYKKLLSIRNAYKELFARGTRTVITSSNEEGYDVFSRSLDKKNVYVALNIKDAEKEITFAVNEKAGTVLTDLYSNTEYVVAKDQTVTVSVPKAAEGGTVILAVKSKNENQQGNGKNEDSGKKDNANKNNNSNNGNSGNNKKSSDNSKLLSNDVASVTQAGDANAESPVMNLINNIFGNRGRRNNSQTQTALEADGNEAVAEEPVAEKTEAAVAETDSSESQENAAIADAEVPLAATDGSTSGFPVIPVAAGAVVLFAAVLGGGFLYTKKKSVK